MVKRRLEAGIELVVFLLEVIVELVGCARSINPMRCYEKWGLDKMYVWSCMSGLDMCKHVHAVSGLDMCKHFVDRGSHAISGLDMCKHFVDRGSHAFSGLDMWKHVLDRGSH